MEKNHPKRRKDRGNPYSIFESDGLFYLSFRDGQGIVHTVEISEELYLAFNSFELEDLSYLNEWDRHIEHSDIWEETLVKRAWEEPYNLEETILRKLQMEQLHKAISKLSEVQRRRLILYYFYDLTYEQIAEKENCSPLYEWGDNLAAEIRIFYETGSQCRQGQNNGGTVCRNLCGLYQC